MADTTLNGFSESLGYAPSLHVKPCPDCARVNASGFGPLSHGLGFSIVSKKPARASVPGLIGFCSPSAIGRLVISIVIDALNRMLWGWTKPHVLKKVFKMSPPIANFNTATPIVLETGISIASTSCVKEAPDPVLCGSGQSVRNRSLSPDTPAADAVAVPQPLSAICNSFSAIASTNPLRPTLWGSFWMQPQNGKVSKSFTSYVLKGMIHGWHDMSTLPATSTFNRGGIYG